MAAVVVDRPRARTIEVAVGLAERGKLAALANTSIARIDANPSSEHGTASQAASLTDRDTRPHHSYALRSSSTVLLRVTVIPLLNTPDLEKHIEDFGKKPGTYIRKSNGSVSGGLGFGFGLKRDAEEMLESEAGVKRARTEESPPSEEMDSEMMLREAHEAHEGGHGEREEASRLQAVESLRTYGLPVERLW